jgi:hypothetical protein
MSTGNRISEEIPQNVIDAVKAKLSEIDTLLKPFYVELSVADKIHLSKVNEKTLPFIEKGVQYINSNPEFLPPYHDAAELSRDSKLFAIVSQILLPAKQIVEQLEKISTLSGSDTYFTIRSYYKSVQRAGAEGNANAKIIANELKKRYEGQGKTSGKTGGKTV